MKYYRRSALWSVLVLVGILGTAVQGFAADSEDARETLHEIPGVRVAIEYLSDDAKRTGLTEAQLQTDVELRLRKAGVRVLTASEWKETPGGPYLYVKAAVVESSLGGLYGYSVDVGLYQTVYLTRNYTQAFAATWSRSLTGTVGGNLFLQSIRGRVGDQIDQFLNAYLAINPRTFPAPSSTEQSDRNRSSVTKKPGSLTAVQDRLNFMGYDVGPSDGVLGKRTQDALRQFQQGMGLAATGQPDAATRRALGLEAGAQQ